MTTPLQSGQYSDVCHICVILTACHSKLMYGIMDTANNQILMKLVILYYQNHSAEVYNQVTISDGCANVQRSEERLTRLT